MQLETAAGADPPMKQARWSQLGVQDPTAGELYGAERTEKTLVAAVLALEVQ